MPGPWQGHLLRIHWPGRSSHHLQSAEVVFIFSRWGTGSSAASEIFSSLILLPSVDEHFVLQRKGHLSEIPGPRRGGDGSSQAGRLVRRWGCGDNLEISPPLFPLRKGWNLNSHAFQLGMVSSKGEDPWMLNVSSKPSRAASGQFPHSTFTPISLCRA